MKDKIAKIALFVALVVIAASYLPWIYLKPAYYVLSYAVMGLLAVSTALTFSFKRTLSSKFVLLFASAIAIVSLEFIFFKVMGYYFVKDDLWQLMVALSCLCLGMNITDDLKFWKDASYYYTICLVIMGLINCLYYAKGFYVPEFYMLNRGKNQVGALIAIGAAALFFFGMKDREQRVHYWIVFFLAIEVLLMIRARSAFFALLACVVLVVIKESNWKWKWSPKTVLSIIGVVFLSYILYTGFIGNELHTFFSGGKNLHNNAVDVLTSNRLERDTEGIKQVVRHPLSSELSKSSGIKLIHNYSILRLVRYGVWSLPFLLFYIYFGIKVLWGIFRNWHTDISQVGYIVCALPFIVSFFEPSFPYGPGEVQLLVFLLLGYSMRSYITLNHPENDIEYKVWYEELKDFVVSKKMKK